MGYARVSKGEGNLEIQIEALRAAGAVRIWQDHDVSGSAVIKPGFIEMLAYAAPGDEIVVWRLDRLARSLITLMVELETLGKRQVEFHSLTEGIATNEKSGGSFFHAIAAFRSFERDVLQERADAERKWPRQPGPA
nr:recombinase family protein [Novosphingobium flavum]